MYICNLLLAAFKFNLVLKAKARLPNLIQAITAEFIVS